MPGAMTPPRYSPFSLTQSNVVAVPTSIGRSMRSLRLLLPVDEGRQTLRADLDLADDVVLGDGVPIAGRLSHERVFAVEMGLGREGDEKLARTGVAAGERDADAH